jgi:ring-1,2-phenylacetyl-CoA epoxidase subunit PaaA
MWQLGLKVDANETLRQRWLSKIIPVFRGLGFEIRPDLVHCDEATGEWKYSGIDWAELKKLIQTGGPRYGEWVERVRRSLTTNSRYAAAAMRAAA